jgi:hypothetical protein
MASEKKRPHQDSHSDSPAGPVAKKAKKKAILELTDLPSFIYDPEAGT